jgi:hypothetical protein
VCAPETPDPPRQGRGCAAPIQVTEAPVLHDPINRIAWLPAEALRPNWYNPNVVFGPELRLLELSILRTGWVQPVLATRDGMIIDGYHRWRLAQESPRLLERYGGRLPVALLDLDEAEAMLLTVRMNRAKGSHVAVKMSELVKTLIDRHGLDRQQIAHEIGATLDEVDLLYQDGVFKARKIAEWQYSKAWYPKEVRGGRGGPGGAGRGNAG